ncbi:hypothetical protein GLOIN_2v1669593 [Rhizophagus clarus]|uniref:Uncharacterized protein n=1 Tax=Rhizophagus clarus TaxID=94130 RepID=A0A8H3L3X4_9GLOM|nr:hypothetical protein GLOIN_2v1669593 [Rhizophagus clarus]
MSTQENRDVPNKRIWLRSTRFQRQKFIDLAREINRINDRNNRRQDVNADTLNRITQIGVQQVTNTPFETDFYNGIQFDKVDLLPWEFPGSPFP